MMCMRIVLDVYVSQRDPRRVYWVYSTTLNSNYFCEHYQCCAGASVEIAQPVSIGLNHSPNHSLNIFINEYINIKARSIEYAHAPSTIAHYYSLSRTKENTSSKTGGHKREGHCIYDPCSKTGVAGCAGWWLDTCLGASLICYCSTVQYCRHF